MGSELSKTKIYLVKHIGELTEEVNLVLYHLVIQCYSLKCSHYNFLGIYYRQVSQQEEGFGGDRRKELSEGCR